MWEFGEWLEVHQEAAGEGYWDGGWTGYEEEMSRVIKVRSSLVYSQGEGDEMCCCTHELGY